MKMLKVHSYYLNRKNYNIKTSPRNVRIKSKIELTEIEVKIGQTYGIIPQKY